MEAAVWLLLTSLAAASPAPPAPPTATPAIPAAPEVPAKPATPPPFEVPKLARMDFAGCGCGAYLPLGTPVPTPSRSDDGALVWTTEQAVGGFTFGVLAVLRPTPTATDDEAEGLLLDFLASLKDQFGIVAAVGVVRGLTLEGGPERGVVDHWTAADGERWTVRGWSTRDHLMVLVLHGPVAYPVPAVLEGYGKGARFDRPRPAGGR